MKMNIIALPFAGSSVRNLRQPFAPSISSSKVKIAIPLMAFIELDPLDAPTAAAGVAYARELTDRHPFTVIMGGVPLECKIIKDPACAFPGMQLLLDGAIPLCMTALAMLDPVSDIISRCA